MQKGASRLPVSILKQMLVLLFSPLHNTLHHSKWRSAVFISTGRDNSKRAAEVPGRKWQAADCWGEKPHDGRGKRQPCIQARGPRARVERGGGNLQPGLHRTEPSVLQWWYQVEKRGFTPDSEKGKSTVLP